MWLITKEWEELWQGWKNATFSDLDTTDMETTSQLLSKRLGKLLREIKVADLNLIRNSINEDLYRYNKASLGNRKICGLSCSSGGIKVVMELDVYSPW